MATPSSIFAWRIPGTEEPGGLQPMGLYSQTQLSNLACSTDVEWEKDSVVTAVERCSAAESGKDPHSKVSLST